jgi:GT2 family glycosyltransferase
MPRVSVIVINYNGEILIKDCLKALGRQNFKDFEIIVLDNGSLDNSIDEIKNFLEVNPISPLIKLIPLGKNYGFAGGCLKGLDYAKGQYIALLNNDTEPDNNWLEELVTAMDSDPNVGICASKLIVYGNDIIDSAGDGFSTCLKGFKRGEGREVSLYNVKQYIFGACAGAALYRRKMIEEIGFLDEDFFLIHEDTDLNFRAQLYGWKALYIPSAIIYHKVRSSIGKMSDIAIYYTLRNTEFVRIKNVPIWLFIRFFPEFIITIMAEFIYFVIKHKYFMLYLKAKRDAFKLLPKMLKKREAILKNRKVSNKYLINIMTPVWQKEFLRAKIKKFLYE